MSPSNVARAALLLGPVVLAFFAGGYGDRPRLAALAVSGLAVALLALTARTPSPRRGTVPVLLAVGGLAGLAGWVALSRTWAPLADAAGDDGERVALYALALVAGALAWQDRRSARWVEPGVALGILVVTAYGLSGRLLPWLVPQTPSATAGGRFEQPLTYWNASGLHAALGLVLCARLAGDRDRPTSMRCAAAAAAVPLASGVYLSFSRGALVALAAGLLVLLVLAPTRTQFRALVITLEAAAFGLFGPLVAPAVRTLQGDRDRDGAIALGVMLAVGAGGVLLMRWAARDEQAQRLPRGPLGLPRWAGTAAFVLVIALVLVPVLVAREGDTAGADPAFGATSTRLASADSHRYAYWRVAVDTFREEPLRGVGSGGYSVAWLAERPQPERIRDAHSLPLETLAELGLVGFLLLLAAAGGVALCARRVQAADPALAAGPAAALTAFALHACIDWDWELPAVTLTALVLAGMLVSSAQRG